MEQFPDHLLIVGDMKVLARILVAEQIKQFGEAAPRDGRRAHAARLMRGDENAVLGVGMALQLPELLDGVDFAVPERGKRLHIGFGEDERQIVLPQHRRAEDLAADGDALAGQRGDVVFDDVHQTVKQLFLHRVAPVSLRMARDHVVPYCRSLP